MISLSIVPSGGVGPVSMLRQGCSTTSYNYGTLFFMVVKGSAAKLEGPRTAVTGELRTPPVRGGAR